MIDIEFIYFFLPVFMGLYVIFPGKYRSLLLTLGTAAVTFWIAPWGLIPMFVSIFSAYFGGLLISKYSENKLRSKLFLTFCILLNSAVFFMFFRSGYFNSGILRKLTFLPAFGTAVSVFHSISYCFDIYLKRYNTEKSFAAVAAYVGFFPCLAAGPVVNFADIRSEIKNPELSVSDMAEGIKFFLFGLAQKLIFSNNLFDVWKDIKVIDINKFSVSSAWLGIIVFSAAFYFEYRSFWYIAAGLSKMLGLSVSNNFRSHFASCRMIDFICRFNSSLTAWCRNYIIKPFARLKKKNTLVIVFSIIVGMLWYGLSSQILFFALALSAIIAAERLLNKKLKCVPKAVRYCFINIIILLCLPLMAFDNIGHSFKYIGAMFGSGSSENGGILTEYILSSCGILLILGGFLSTGIFRSLKCKINSINENLLPIVMPVFEIALLIISTAFIVGTEPEYLRFLF